MIRNVPVLGGMAEHELGVPPRPDDEPPVEGRDDDVGQARAPDHLRRGLAARAALLEHGAQPLRQSGREPSLGPAVARGAVASEVGERAHREGQAEAAEAGPPHARAQRPLARLEAGLVLSVDLLPLLLQHSGASV